jgi:hypothetical protein
MKKYLDPKEVAKRHSKTNLTKGSFGKQKYVNVNLTVVPKHLRTKETCNKYGIKGQDIIFTPIESKKLPLQTPKGKITSSYVQYRVGKNKNSKDYSKGK